MYNLLQPSKACWEQGPAPGRPGLSVDRASGPTCGGWAATHSAQGPLVTGPDLFPALARPLPAVHPKEGVPPIPRKPEARHVVDSG
jgi:hypothetical protein